MSEAAVSPSYEPWARGMPWRRAKSSARPRSREATAVRLWRVWRWTERAKRSAIQPVPRMPQRKAGAAIGSGVWAAGRAVGKAGIAKAPLERRDLDGDGPAAVPHGVDDRR